MSTPPPEERPKERPKERAKERRKEQRQERPEGEHEVKGLAFRDDGEFSPDSGDFPEDLPEGLPGDGEGGVEGRPRLRRSSSNAGSPGRS